MCMVSLERLGAICMSDNTDKKDCIGRRSGDDRRKKKVEELGFPDRRKDDRRSGSDRRKDERS